VNTDDLYDNYCRGCGKPSDYVYCEKCAKTKKCPHSNVIDDGCDMCNYESDMAYDASRERS